MSIESEFHQAAQELDWSKEDQVDQLLTYIGNQQSPAAFLDFLREQKAEHVSFDLHDFSLSTINREHAALRELIFDELTKLGVQEVEVEYSGSGDEGEYQWPVADTGIINLRQVKIPALTVESLAANSSCQITILTPRDNPEGPKQVSLADAISAFAEGWGEEKHGGWWNDTGAHGNFTFLVESRAVRWNHGENVEDTEWYQYKL